MVVKLGILLIESQDGQCSVQLFSDPLKGREMFSQLVLAPKQQPYRATYITLDWQGKIVEAHSREVPSPEEGKFDGWVLGSGPLVFPAPTGIAALTSDTENNKKES